MRPRVIGRIPWYAPPGTYVVNLGIGPSWSNPTGWSQRSASFVVSPFC